MLFFFKCQCLALEIHAQFFCHTRFPPAFPSPPERVDFNFFGLFFCSICDELSEHTVCDQRQCKSLQQLFIRLVITREWFHKSPETRSQSRFRQTDWSWSWDHGRAPCSVMSWAKTCPLAGRSRQGPRAALIRVSLGEVLPGNLPWQPVPWLSLVQMCTTGVAQESSQQGCWHSCGPW